jgi:outer membrane protein TolC
LPEQYDAGLVEALAKRPELRKARLQVVRSKMALDMEKGAYLPTIDAQGRYYVDDSRLTYHNDRANWVTGIILNWDLFTGMSTRAGVDKARAVLDEVIAADRKAALGVQLDVKTAYLRLSEARGRLAVTTASVAQAEETLHLVKKQYEGGAATVTRYLEAELDLSTARTRNIAARFDVKKAQADVGRAVGYCGLCARKELDER